MIGPKRDGSSSRSGNLWIRNAQEGRGSAALSQDMRMLKKKLGYSPKEESISMPSGSNIKEKRREVNENNTKSRYAKNAKVEAMKQMLAKKKGKSY